MLRRTSMKKTAAAPASESVRTAGRKPGARSGPPAATDLGSAAPPVSLAGRQTPRRLQRAGEIVAAAREVFLEKGFQGASVAEIAARVGVVEGLVYSYFPTKRDLLNEVLQQMYVPLMRDVENGFARTRGLRSRLRFLVWRHLRVYVEEPKLSRLVLHEVRLGPEYFGSVLHDLHVAYTAFLVRTLNEAIETGELPAGTDVELVRSMVYGGLEHRMWSVLFGRGVIDVEATADRFTDMVLASIAPAPLASDVEQRLARLERIVAGLVPARDEAAAPAPARASRRSRA